MYWSRFLIWKFFCCCWSLDFNEDIYIYFLFIPAKTLVSGKSLRRHRGVSIHALVIASVLYRSCSSTLPSSLMWCQAIYIYALVRVSLAKMDCQYGGHRHMNSSTDSSGMLGNGQTPTGIQCHIYLKMFLVCMYIYTTNTPCLHAGCWIWTRADSTPIRTAGRPK